MGKSLVKLILTAVLPAAAILILGYAVSGKPLWELDIASVAEMYRSLGGWAVAISLALNIIQTFVVFMPSVFLSGANAAVFGLFWGTVISWAGETVGAALAFVFYRYVGRSSFEELESHGELIKRVNDLGSRRGFRVILVLRLLPAIPSGAINLMAAVSRMNFMSFMAATALGKLPSLVLETLVGHDLLFWEENLSRLLTVLGLVFAGYLAYWLKTSCEKKE